WRRCGRTHARAHALPRVNYCPRREGVRRVFGPEERPPARHAARSSFGRRRFLLAIAVLAALASVPSLAVVLAGAASLDAPPGSRSPYVADGAGGPVLVGPSTDARLRPGARPHAGLAPALTRPAPQATSP